MLVRAARCRQAARVAERVRVREIDDDEGRRLLRIVRRGTGSVVTWRRAQVVLLSPQGMPVGKIAKSKPAEHGLPFSTWSLAKLADFLVAEGVADDISHEGLRVLLREEGVSFQRIKTWKASRDPDYATKKARVERLYAIADGEVMPEEGEPEVVFCLDEFGPLNLQPHPGRQWAERGGRHKDPGREARPRRRATYTRPHGVRHLFAAYDLGKDKLYGHIKPRKHWTEFLEFCRYLRGLYPPEIRIAFVLDNFSPHLTTKKDGRIDPHFVRRSSGQAGVFGSGGSDPLTRERTGPLGVVAGESGEDRCERPDLAPAAPVTLGDLGGEYPDPAGVTRPGAVLRVEDCLGDLGDDARTLLLVELALGDGRDDLVARCVRGFSADVDAGRSVQPEPGDGTAHRVGGVESLVADEDLGDAVQQGRLGVRLERAVGNVHVEHGHGRSPL
ncbi:hypothetical protein AB0J35_16815 [Nonomuraea angiospora]|uniref:hypothetical protein n=1 Tax=Nonomuraea angiospora TaxID=46172 RepID=UPI00344408BB